MIQSEVLRYRFIDGHKQVWLIDLMYGVLGVSRSGFYDWAGRDPSWRAQANVLLNGRIHDIFLRHRQRYGSPRIVDELRDEGIACSENRVARRMRILELKAIQARKFKVTTDSNHTKPVARDLIEQDFAATAPNQKWCSDITYVCTNRCGCPGVRRRGHAQVP